MAIPVTVLAVDDQPPNLRLLDAVLTPRGHRVITARSGAEALALLETEDVDIVLLDIVMPEMDGHEVCRRIRSTPATEFLPVVMITASGTEQRLAALESGADDFVTKPFDKSELLARVASLARIKRYHDTIRRQADELAAWNTELETRVAQQVAELERTNRLRRFLSPQLADLVVSDEHLLESHRREIVVVFCDLRNFTPFARNSEPEEVMGVLREYHAAIGAFVHEYEGTLERFTGDGIMAFFNDPVPQDDAAERAVRMSIGIRDAVRELAERWSRGAMTSRWESASPKTLRPSAGSASRAASIMPPSAASPISRPGCVPMPAPGRCWSPTACSRPPSTWAWPKWWATLQPKGFSRTVRVHNISALNDYK